MYFHGEDLFGNLTKEEEEETERILRNARRRKRKHRNSMITIFEGNSSISDFLASYS